MAGFTSKMARAGLALALALSSMAGLVCADGPDERQAMECCRGDAQHCNMPEKTEECCKPDRASQNPASMEQSDRCEIGVAASTHAPVLAPVVPTPETVHTAVPFSSSRGSPYGLANRPLDVPLLN